MDLYQLSFWCSISTPAPCQSAISVMGARPIAPRNERCCVACNRLECLENVLGLCDMLGVLCRTYEDEIVVHHRVTLRAFPLCYEGEFGGLGVYENHIGIAAAARVEGLATALSHHLDGNPGALLDEGKQIVEKTRVLGG